MLHTMHVHTPRVSARVCTYRPERGTRREDR